MSAESNDPARATCHVQLDSLAVELTENLQHYEQLETFFGLSLDLLCIMNRTHLLRISSSWQNVLGWDNGRLISQPFAEFLHPDDRAKVLREHERNAEASGEIVRQQSRWRTQDGEYRLIIWCCKWERGLCYAVGRDCTDCPMRRLAKGCNCC
jgi:PAS domain S-box-containing protein